MGSSADEEQAGGDVFPDTVHLNVSRRAYGGFGISIDLRAASLLLELLGL
jgi:hypothetical protein